MQLRFAMPMVWSAMLGALKNFVDEQAKLGKPDKEEKKESVFNVRNIALALIASSPITGPLYVWWFRLLMGT